jgi:hypothetical protein
MQFQRMQHETPVVEQKSLNLSHSFWLASVNGQDVRGARDFFGASKAFTIQLYITCALGDFRRSPVFVIVQ